MRSVGCVGDWHGGLEVSSVVFWHLFYRCSDRAALFSMATLAQTESASLRALLYMVFRRYGVGLVGAATAHRFVLWTSWQEQEVLWTLACAALHKRIYLCTTKLSKVCFSLCTLRRLRLLLLRNGCKLVEHRVLWI